MTTIITDDHPLAYAHVELITPAEGWGLDCPATMHPAGTRGLVIEVFSDGGIYLDLDVPDGHSNPYHYDFATSWIGDVVPVRTFELTDEAHAELCRIRDTGELVGISDMTDDEIKERFFGAVPVLDEPGQPPTA